jgi:septum formation protein
MPVVLGSGSPRRREILGALRVPFVVVPGDADEDVHLGESPGAYLERVTLAKLASVRARVEAPHAHAHAHADAHGHGHAYAAILVADTSVIVDGAILGKPASDEEGIAMIARLQGRAHEVHTRFAVGAAGEAGARHAETVVTRVVFRDVSPAEARDYVATGEGRDKAGGYAVQGLAAAFVARIEGSYTNVVGLPACEVLVALRRLGVVAPPASP